jgi:hypothetical protein
VNAVVCATVGRIRQARERVGVRSGDDGGNAILEFVVLSAFLMVPLVYLIIAVLRVQGSAYGVTEAAREAGRAFVEASSSDDGYRQACTAATIALQNQLPGAFDCASLKVSCISDGECATTELVPGETIRVAIDIDVGLPFMPTSVFGQSLTIRLHALHDEVVDSFRSRR